MVGFSRILRAGLFAAIGVTALALAGCAEYEGALPKHMRPLDEKTRELVDRKGMDQKSPILIRLFKEEATLEVWKQQRATGKYALLKEYEICAWSGVLGPKIKEGDRQAPEGFYTIRPAQMNPDSSYYLAFNMGYPNEFDRAHGRTGSELMVHGACSSRGCYSMTDENIQEIYTLGRLAFQGGQRDFQVQAFPFRMTPENMARHRSDPNMPFWRMLKEGYDHFEVVRQPPKVDVCNRRYVFNSMPADGRSFAATAACPLMVMPDAIRVAVAAKEAKDEEKMREIAAKLNRRQGGGSDPLLLALAEPTTVELAAPMSVPTGAVDPTMTASVEGAPASSTAAPAAEPVPVEMANAPATAAPESAVRVIDPPPAQTAVAPVAPVARASEEPFLPMPDLRGGEDAAPPSAAPAPAPSVAAAPAAEPPQPAPTAAAAASVAADPATQAATLEERMFVESAPVDPDVANAYATAEEGGLTGLVLRLYQQDPAPAE